MPAESRNLTAIRIAQTDFRKTESVAQERACHSAEFVTVALFPDRLGAGGGRIDRRPDGKADRFTVSAARVSELRDCWPVGSAAGPFSFACCCSDVPG